MREQGACERLLIVLPLCGHVSSSAEYRVDRYAEPLHDTSVDQRKPEEEKEHGWNQRERHKRNKNARLEFGSRLLLFSFDPNLHHVAQQHKTEDEEDKEYERGKKKEQNNLVRFGRCKQWIEVECRLGEDKQSEHEEEQARGVELTRLWWQFHSTSTYFEARWREPQ